MTRVSTTTILFTSLLAANAMVGARPNVILIMTDDQGYGDLRCHGNPVIETPNIDKLYEQSVRFTDFHVDPSCSPDRCRPARGRPRHRQVRAVSDQRDHDGTRHF